MSGKKQIAAALCLLVSINAQAEEIFYGNRSVLTEIRADTSTLILLPAPPLSVSCQPVNRIQVQALDGDSLTSIEAGYVTVSKSDSQHQENPMLKRMIRVIPAPGKGGDSTDCIFNMANGQPVGAKFLLKNDITRPFIEFKPLSTRNVTLTDPARNLALDAIKSSVGGDPIQTLREDRPFLGYRSGATHEKAKYRITYRGGNGGSLTLWRIEGVVRPPKVSYDEVAVLNPATGSIFYSTLIPEQPEFQDGDHFVLHVVGSNSLTEEELLKALR